MIGLLGGTFDPIHYGHLRSALEVQMALGLSELRLIPLNQPPHRPPPVLDAAARLELLRLAVAGQPGFQVDDRELLRPGRSYTLDTLKSLRTEIGDREPIGVLLGLDAFQGFPDWHRPQEILELAHLIVMRRPAAVMGGDPRIEPLLSRHGTDNPESLHAAAAGLILPVEVSQLDISSTRIRAMLRQGLSPRFLLPDQVLEVILRRGYYPGALPAVANLG